MLYQRSLDIEQRLRLILALIRTGRYSTPQLANEVGVSIPTISRDVQALRERGHEIRSQRGDDGWRYVMWPVVGAASKPRTEINGRIRRRAK